MYIPRSFKKVLIILIFLLTPFYIYQTIQFVELHGFIKGIIFWFTHSWQDPILAFAEVDFLTLMLIVFGLIALDFRKQNPVLSFRLKFLAILFVPLWLYCPSYFTILYLLSRREDRVQSK